MEDWDRHCSFDASSLPSTRNASFVCEFSTVLSACAVLRNLLVMPVAAQLVKAAGRLGGANNNVA